MADFLDPGTGVLTEDQCWEVMTRTEIGRLAICRDNGPEIFPVNFVVDNRTVLIRTAAGTKLTALAAAGVVAFEVDGFSDHRSEAWSVVIRGPAKVLEGLNEVFAARELPLVPWDATPKPVFVRIHPVRVSGRRFAARGVGET